MPHYREYCLLLLQPRDMHATPSCPTFKTREAGMLSWLPRLLWYSHLPPEARAAPEMFLLQSLIFVTTLLDSSNSQSRKKRGPLHLHFQISVGSLWGQESNSYSQPELQGRWAMWFLAFWILQHRKDSTFLKEVGIDIECQSTISPWVGWKTPVKSSLGP